MKNLKIAVISLIATNLFSGAVQNNSHIRDNTNNIILDSRTGLIWSDTAPQTKTWINAIDYCENLTIGSFTNWRLPNINELESITDRRAYSPATSTSFQNIQSNKYFSSTTYVGEPTKAWIKDFYYGASSFELKTDSLNVICVVDDNKENLPTVNNLIIADAYGFKHSINGDEEADTNYNNSKLYTAGEQWTAWGTGRTFIKINILEIPNSAQNINLKLYAYGGDTRSGYDAKINVYKITSNWDENTITWNTTPTFDTNKIYDSVIINHDSIEGWYSFNITELVQEWKNGTKNYGLILYCPDDYSGGGYRNFYSKDNTEHVDKRPKIEFQ